MENNEKEILKKLEEASKKNYFTLTLSLNGKKIEEIEFSAEKYNPQTLLETRTYFLMSDLRKIVLEIYSKKEQEIQEKLKQDQINKLWGNHKKNI